jgi:hypothetical protein
VFLPRARCVHLYTPRGPASDIFFIIFICSVCRSPFAQLPSMSFCFPLLFLLRYLHTPKSPKDSQRGPTFHSCLRLLATVPLSACFPIRWPVLGWEYSSTGRNQRMSSWDPVRAIHIQLLFLSYSSLIHRSQHTNNPCVTSGILVRAKLAFPFVQASLPSAHRPSISCAPRVDCLHDPKRTSTPWTCLWTSSSQSSCLQSRKRRRRPQKEEESGTSNVNCQI